MSRSRLLIVAYWLVVFIPLACTYDSAELSNISCITDGDCPADATCEQGYCLRSQELSDAGPIPDTNQGDDDTSLDPDVIDDPDANCEPLSHEEFCQTNNVECGVFMGDDICGNQREVDCGFVLQISCQAGEFCARPQEDATLQTNTCRCSIIDDSDDVDAQICATAAVECGAVNAGDLCQGWAAHGEVNCGGCDDGDPCTDSLCHSGACEAHPICEGTDTDCGCTTCTDCTAYDGWHDLGASYQCCDGDQICTCQDQQFRAYYCDGTTCDYTVEDTQIVRVIAKSADD